MKAPTTLAALALLIIVSAGCAHEQKDPSDRLQDQIMNKRAEEILQRNDRFPRATRGEASEPADVEGARRRRARSN